MPPDKPLSFAQRRALRMLDSDDHHYHGLPTASTLRSLGRRGLAHRENGEWFISEAGLRLIRSYVGRTSNGPEDLKERFSWLR